MLRRRRSQPGLCILFQSHSVTTIRPNPWEPGVISEPTVPFLNQLVELIFCRVSEASNSHGGIEPPERQAGEEMLGGIGVMVASAGRQPAEHLQADRGVVSAHDWMRWGGWPGGAERQGQ